MNMSAGKLTTLVAASALLVPAGLDAQGHQAHHPRADSPDAPRQAAPMGMMSGSCPMMGSGMMSGGKRMMMSGGTGMAAMMPGPHMLLRQQEVLGLTGDQVAQLEELSARAEELRSTRRPEMASIRDQLRSVADADELDLERYESLLRQRADLRVEGQLRRAEIHRDALDVLDEEQRSRLEGMTGMMQAPGGMSGGPGMMNMMRQMDAPGMMQMMQMMSRMHQRMHGQDCPTMPQDEDGEG